jgi:toxin ParE1/3/4
MKRVRLHGAARAEVREAMRNLENERPGWAKKFKLELDRLFALILRHPRVGARHETTLYRRFGMKTFPYIIYYRDLADTIWIVAVSHGKRRPNYWIGRSPS